ncbi:uncharacterized protein LOC18438809 [Amborella trichopoda]|uniref:SWIM-type domain-containing protein n=1 Tax=Amborella trichopoda TaxID=13333 RepID=W1PS13_AMBTC|nr:uncharacterized protein LOC18438809 [Amborella trichopoda]ERN10629.1 hypothetical protein AMTR_s00028p00186520 [Amborella trichopoda]|eukprot:XP_006849048.1 uncharacterized protein LOC18438809 [Amborella trichopoda]
MKYLVDNFKKANSNSTLTKLYWKAICTLYISDFDEYMAKIKSANTRAYDWMMLQHPKYWANTHFKGCRYNHLTSNISESFNQCIFQAREKPLIKLLEILRVKLMGEFSNKMTRSLEWSDVLIPKTQKVIDLRRDKPRFFHADTWAHDGMYEINADKKYALNLEIHTCSCRVWQVGELSCSHAIAVIDHRHEDVINFCGIYFIVQMYRRTYSLPFNKMPNVLELPEIVYTTVMLSAVRRTAGRPKKHRRQTKYKEIKRLKCS